MPVYEWKCKNCGAEWARFSPTYEPETPKCPTPNCYNPRIKRKLSVPQFKFVGAGFHCNDYHKDRPKDFDEFVNGTPHQRHHSEPDEPEGDL